MASPQLESGYTRIANEILEALSKVNLSPYESRTLWFLLRKTYGWKKKKDWIALSQFSKGLGLDRRHVHRALKSLSSKQMTVIGRDDRNHPTYGFQKDYSKWPSSSKQMTVPLQMTDCASTDDQSVPLLVPTKETTKETIQKTRVESNGASQLASRERFGVFWQAYPRKKNKGNAEKAWQRIKPGPELLKIMIDAIKQAEKSEDWLKKGGAIYSAPRQLVER